MIQENDFLYQSMYYVVLPPLNVTIVYHQLSRLHKGQTKAGQKSAAGWARLAGLSCWKLKSHQAGPN